MKRHIFAYDFDDVNNLYEYVELLHPEAEIDLKIKAKDLKDLLLLRLIPHDVR